VTGLILSGIRTGWPDAGLFVLVSKIPVQVTNPITALSFLSPVGCRGSLTTCLSKV
jgi:hypothetical protein